MLKRILVLFLVLSLVHAVSLEKKVEGSSVLAEGDSLNVRIALESDSSLKLISLEDSIPQGFSARNYPSSCDVEGDTLRCEYDIQIDTFSISYQLIASDSGRNIRISGATLKYVNPETQVDESVVSNDIETAFFIGLPKIFLNLTNFQVDGASKSEVLPEAVASVVLQVKNTGSIDAENVSISITSPLFSETKKLDILRPDASTSFKLTKTAPQIASFSEGEATISVIASWTDLGKRQYAPAQDALQFVFVRPKLFVTRDVDVKWKKDEILKPFIQISVELENTGSAVANADIAQELPPSTEPAVTTQGFIENNVWKLGVDVEPGEKKRISIMVPAEKGKVDIPPLNVDYVDARNNIYERSIVETEEIEVEKSVWAMVYQAVVEPIGEKGVYAAGIIFLAALLLLSRLRNPPVMVALAVVAVVCALILYTWYVV